MKDSKLLRAQWRLGKIEKLFSSGDGKIRSVQLRLANRGFITRPLKLLYPLEMQVDNKSETVEGYANAIYTIQCPISDGSDDEFQGFDTQDV